MKTIQRRYDILLLIILACFPVFKYSITSILAIVFLCVTLFVALKYYGEELNSNLSIKKTYFLITVFFYFVFIVSLLYSSNIKYGLTYLEHGLYIPLFPFVIFFLVPSLSKKQINWIWFGFIISCNLYVGYLHYFFYTSGLYSSYRETKINDLPFRDVLMNLEWGSGHPTYVSMWFLFSAVFLIHFLWQERLSWVGKIFIAVDIVVLVVTSVLLSSKISVVAFVISVAVLMCIIVKNKLLLLSSLVAIIVIFLVSVFNVSFLRARFVDEFEITEMKPPIGIQTNSINIRVGIFQCTMEVFSANWLIGTGVGDAQDELNRCYEKFDTNVYKQETYNTHNNFLDIAISTGILGLASFVFMLAFHIRESIRYKNTLFLVFIVFFVICMLPENILSRNSGVVFYALFSSLMMKQNLQTRILK